MDQSGVYLRANRCRIFFEKKEGTTVKFIAVYYWPQEGEKFDKEYYRTKHLPMAKKELPGAVSVTYCNVQPPEEGVNPNVKGIGIVSWKDMESFQKAMASPGRDKLMADIPLRQLQDGFSGRGGGRDIESFSLCVNFIQNGAYKGPLNPRRALIFRALVKRVRIDWSSRSY
jgi:uncharacterized protein (TIGR02118 family)